MASDWFMRIYRSILAEEINIQNRDMACKLGCGLFLSPQKLLYLQVSHTARLSPSQSSTLTVVSNLFANSQTIFRFRFFSKKNKPTPSATIVLTLWIYRTEDERQSCILVWHDSKKRCVNCNQPIVRAFGRHSCMARATAICILHIVESFRSYSTIEEE